MLYLILFYLDYLSSLGENLEQVNRFTIFTGVKYFPAHWDILLTTLIHPGTISTPKCQLRDKRCQRDLNMIHRKERNAIPLTNVCFQLYGMFPKRKKPCRSHIGCYLQVPNNIPRPLRFLPAKLLSCWLSFFFFFFFLFLFYFSFNLKIFINMLLLNLLTRATTSQ